MKWMGPQQLAQDIRYSLRQMRRSPVVVLVAIVTLALGIGANSAMFSVVDALLLNPLKFRDPAALAIVWDKDAQAMTWSASPANLIDWRKQSKSIEEFAGWIPASYVRTGNDRPEQFSGASVTANFFHVLGIAPQLGRTFDPDN